MNLQRELLRATCAEDLLQKTRSELAQRTRAEACSKNSPLGQCCFGANYLLVSISEVPTKRLSRLSCEVQEDVLGPSLDLHPAAGEGNSKRQAGQVQQTAPGPGIVAYVSKRDEEHLNGQLSGRGKTDTKHVVNGSEGE